MSRNQPCQHRAESWSIFLLRALRLRFAGVVALRCMDQGCFEPISFEPFGAGHFADLARSDVSGLADRVTESTSRSSCAAVADESRTISFELWSGLLAASLGGHLHSLWGGCSSAPFCVSYSTSRHRVEFGTSKHCRFLGLEAIAQAIYRGSKVLAKQHLEGLFARSTS